MRRSLSEILRLAIPVSLGELGWIGMGVVDVVMVGRLGVDAIAAAGIGVAVYEIIGLCGIGMLLGLDTLVSQAWGARHDDECDEWLRQGVLLSALITPLLMAVIWLFPLIMRVVGVNASIAEQAAPYSAILNWSVFPLLIYASFRRYLQGMGMVNIAAFALISANAVNALLNWVLIYGHWGAPAMGVNGSAWATLIARIYMAGCLVVYAAHVGNVLRRLPEWSVTRLRRLVGLGAPAAAQLLLEVGVFAGATVLSGKLDALSVAGHQIALSTAATSFAVPLGVSSAGAVAVGHAVGRGDLDGARRSGWAAIMIGTLFMAIAGTFFALAPEVVVRAFTSDAKVLPLGVSLLRLVALFQLFDGAQVVAIGVLRGIGDTRSGMLAGLGGYWLLAMPAGYYLTFHRGVGIHGIWIGLTLGLMTVAVVLIMVWHRRSHPQRFPSPGSDASKIQAL